MVSSTRTGWLYALWHYRWREISLPQPATGGPIVSLQTGFEHREDTDGVPGQAAGRMIHRHQREKALSSARNAEARPGSVCPSPPPRQTWRSSNEGGKHRRNIFHLVFLGGCASHLDPLARQAKARSRNAEPQKENHRSLTGMAARLRSSTERGPVLVPGWSRGFRICSPTTS